jgi:hypothetical protein
MKVLIISWLLAAANTWIPIPKPHEGEKPESYLKRAGETHEAAVARRTKHMTAIFTVVFDPTEKPLFGGPHGRMMTAMFLDSIMSFEGTYSRLVDEGKWNGDCKILGEDGKPRACTVKESEKLGQSFCQMQIKIGTQKTKEGWSKKDLLADPEKCVRAGLHRLQDYGAACMAAPYKFTWDKNGIDIYSPYATGSCIKGNPEIHHRWERAKSRVLDSPFPAADSDVMSILLSSN